MPAVPPAGGRGERKRGERVFTRGRERERAAMAAVSATAGGERRAGGARRRLRWLAGVAGVGAGSGQLYRKRERVVWGKREREEREKRERRNRERFRERELRRERKREIGF